MQLCQFARLSKESDAANKRHQLAIGKHCILLRSRASAALPGHKQNKSNRRDMCDCAGLETERNGEVILRTTRNEKTFTLKQVAALDGVMATNQRNVAGDSLHSEVQLSRGNDARLNLYNVCNGHCESTCAAHSYCQSGKRSVPRCNVHTCTVFPDATARACRQRNGRFLPTS